MCNNNESWLLQNCHDYSVQIFRLCSHFVPKYDSHWVSLWTHFFPSAPVPGKRSGPCTWAINGSWVLSDCAQCLSATLFCAGSQGPGLRCQVLYILDTSFKVCSQLNISYMFHFQRSAMVFSTLNHLLFNPMQRWLFPLPLTRHSSCSSYRHKPSSFSHLKFWFRMATQDQRDFMSPISHLDFEIMI